MDTLYSSIFKICCNSADCRYFVPSHLGRQVMTAENVQKVLLDSRIEMHHVKGAVEIIRNGAWNVFAILILIKQPRGIVSFIEDIAEPSDIPVNRAPRVCGLEPVDLEIATAV